MPIYLNSKKVESFNFSGGECQVKIDAAGIEVANITAILNSSDAIMQLLLVVDAVRRINPKAEINLLIPYFPYARQDRVCNPGEALSVRVMADLINSVRADVVTIIDPHSDVTAAILNNVKVIKQSQIIAESVLAKIIKDKKLIVISPDAGAEKKTKEAAKLVGAESMAASKVRDTMTGNIISTQIHGDVKGRDVIILDDICDGGATFTELAKELKNHGAKNIYLYVTHGIFSRGLDILKEHFSHVYCYHSLVNEFEGEAKFLTKLGTI